MAFTEEDRKRMDAAAIEAQNELNEIPDEHVLPVAVWFRKHFGEAGHKRLGRVLVEAADELQPLKKE